MCIWPENRPPLKLNFRWGLFCGPNWFDQQEARYYGFVVYTRIKSIVPIETTNPLYLASGCFNQFGPGNRHLLNFLVQVDQTHIERATAFSLHTNLGCIFWDTLYRFWFKSNFDLNQILITLKKYDLLCELNKFLTWFLLFKSFSHLNPFLI